MIGTGEDSIKTDVSDLHLFLINGRIMWKSINLLKFTKLHLYEDFLLAQLILKVNFVKS